MSYSAPAGDSTPADDPTPTGDSTPNGDSALTGNDLDVLCFATQGPDSGDHQRIAYLLDPLGPRFLDVHRHRKTDLPRTLLREIGRRRPDVVVLEGTGVAGGVAVMAARLLRGVPYLVSSGDAVAPFLRTFDPRLGPPARLYERSLCRLCAGYIGWSPYLVGRALSLGAPRGATAAHFSRGHSSPGAREAVRTRLGIPPEAIVIGIAGSIRLNVRLGYSYGVELIRALRLTTRPELRVLIVGDGTGLENLVALAGDELGRRVLLPGRCPPEEVADHLAAMDIGALSQSTNVLGSMRYTTKLPEYVAAGLPVVATEVPVAYDLDTGWLWRLPGDAPWHEDHIVALSQFMQTVTREEIARKAACVPRDPPVFSAELQQQRVCALVREATARSARAPAGRKPETLGS